MTELLDAAARTRITTALDETLFVEAGAGSGKTKSLIDRIVALIDDGIPMEAIAAITFSEKAAAELRDRIRRVIEARRRDATDAAAASRYQSALDQVDTAAISTLHAFAQRILTEHAIEAGLPPNIEVLGEVASQIEFDHRWNRFRDALLDNPELERTLLLAFAADIRIDDLRRLASVFQDNWDLLSDPDRLPWGDAAVPEVAVAAVLGRLEALLARRNECRADDDSLMTYLNDVIEPYARRLADAPDEYEQLRILRERNPTFKAGNRGRAANWGGATADIRAEITAVGEAKQAVSEKVARACVCRIAVEVAAFVLDAAKQRRAGGRLEFHDLLVLARDLLRGDEGIKVRRRLGERYQRLLLDEFHDTDPIQTDLAVLIASDDPQAATKPWWNIPVEPGRLFFVGDPKQSIYRFRRADINLFLKASGVFGDPPVALTTNFRATPPVIDWVNDVFGELIRYEPDSQPAYQPLDAALGRGAPGDGHPVVLLGADPHERGSADELREHEAADVADAVMAARGWQVSERRPDGSERWRPAQLNDITILLPARTSLVALETALDARGVPYRAETSSLVYSTREVRELMAACRAVADPTDQLALVTALRSPLFGCGDDDLFVYRVEHHGEWSLLKRAPDSIDPAHPVVEALTYLREMHRDLPWLTPSEVLQRLAADRRLFELGYAAGRPRDLWRRLRFVIDQARAWSEAEGGTLREYLDWARMQASESARVAETVLPETDDESVRVLTIHGSKGLEFPITIVSGMTSQARSQHNRVDVVFPAQGPAAIKVGRGATTPEYEAFKPIDEQMDFHERLRLLYVACTRAQDHLVVSLHRKVRDLGDEQRKWTSAELLAAACQGASHQLPLAPVDDAAPDGASAAEPSADLPDLAAWQTERDDALADSGRWRSIGASDLVTVDVELDEDAAAGADKRPRDLELPPWQKGRYGSAIGRAVHGVLQTVDLETGAGLDEAAGAQAAAEGVLGRENTVRRLAAFALEAPVVKRAVTRPRWRETYVATAIGDRTLEGYIDLLFRDEDGLVIVDYKTASSSADLDARVDRYRAQGGAYAVAVEQATGDHIAKVVFVFLTADGAVEKELADLGAAKAAVRDALTTTA